MYELLHLREAIDPNTTGHHVLVTMHVPPRVGRMRSKAWDDLPSIGNLDCPVDLLGLVAVSVAGVTQVKDKLPAIVPRMRTLRIGTDAHSTYGTRSFCVPRSMALFTQRPKKENVVSVPVITRDDRWSPKQPLLPAERPSVVHFAQYASVWARPLPVGLGVKFKGTAVTFLLFSRVHSVSVTAASVAVRGTTQDPWVSEEARAFVSE